MKEKVDQGEKKSLKTIKIIQDKQEKLQQSPKSQSPTRSNSPPLNVNFGNQLPQQNLVNAPNPSQLVKKEVDKLKTELSKKLDTTVK